MHRRRHHPRLARLAGASLLTAILTAVLVTPLAHAEEWRPIAPGVDYRLFEVGGPNRVHVARLAISTPELIVESSIGSGALSQGFETVSGMADRYDGSLLAWGGDWGPRARVLVAINGSSFDAESGQPYGGTFQSGWYAEEYGDLAGGTGFVWTSDRQGLVRGCVEHLDELQLVTHLATGEQFEISSLNLESRRSGLIMYTQHFGAATPSGERVFEVVLSVDRPVGAEAYPEYAMGTVRVIRDGMGGMPLLFDEIVLAARGSEARQFARTLRPGEQVGISREITDLGFGCRTQSGFDWSRVYSAIGGGFVFLRDGRIRQSDDAGAFAREPRTAVCVNDEYVYFVVVDGRKPGVSVGMELGEVAEFCRDELSAQWGLNQDGGGSSTMWVDGQIVNTPSDGHERGVANGLMMVAVEPAFRSRRFDEGYQVEVRAPVEFRTGPGPTYPVLWIATPGQIAHIAGTSPPLRGVFADGSFWWKADVAGTMGFLPEQALVVGDDAQATFRLPAPPLAEADR